MARRLHSIGITGIVALIAMFSLLSVASAAPAMQDPTGSVEASDQAVVDGSINVSLVSAGQDGWIVAHLDEGGKPGKVIGQTAVKKGDNKDVKIKLGEDVAAGGKLWPMLHIDAGTIGTYEFPGADVPVVVGGNVVMKQITVTAAAAAPPSNLPRTGGADSPATGLLLGAMALLLGGALLRMRRRA
jgi:LPXTG-motif cell wall-anchored protein